MAKKITFLAVLGLCLFWLGIDPSPFASDIEKRKAIPVSFNPTVPVPHSLTTTGERFCLIHSDSNSVAYYYPDTIPGNGFALYMDPEMCSENPYPFKITGVQFYLCHYIGGDTAVWPVEIRVNIKKVKKDSLCLGQPGTLLYSQTFTIPIDSSYDSLGKPMNLSLDFPTPPTCCPDTSFFLEIVFTGGTSPPFPSFIMGDSALDFPDTCNAWFFNDGKYYEWSKIWAHPFPGCPIMRMIGHTNSWDCDSCWYWKPDTITSPSGMPDFDQYQFGDSSALDVPTASANALWWLDSIPENTNPPDLIRLLSNYFDTDPDSGTLISSLQNGLSGYFGDYGFDLTAQVYPQPDFYEMADSLQLSQNVILLLGFWQFYEDSWHRFGGHAVTLAGVCLESLWVSISDPAVDGAELGWQGRFFPLWHPEHDTMHNNPVNVSHDIYLSENGFVVDADTLWRIKDFYEADNSFFSQFEGKNFQPEQQPDFHSYVPTETVFTVAEYAITISSKFTAVEEEEEEEIVTPRDFKLFQNHPNPFNPSTKIPFTVHGSQFMVHRPIPVTLKIYNILGQKVRTLVDEPRRPGSYEVIWDGKDEKGKELSSGIYFYQLTAGHLTQMRSTGKVGVFTQTKRMLLLK